jgi:hypothetical protein
MPGGISGEFAVSPIAIIQVEGTPTQMKAYPNPVRSKLTIESFTSLSEVEVRLTDTRGGIVRSLILSPDSWQTIDVSDLKPGTYFLQWQSQKGTESKTIIVIP